MMLVRVGISSKTVCTEVLKGRYNEEELPIIIHYGLDPEATKKNDSYPHQFSEKGARDFVGPAFDISLYDEGGEGGKISGDIRKDQIWFLRTEEQKGAKYQGGNNVSALGIWDPQDIQLPDLKPYFQAFLRPHPETELKAYANGESRLATRSKIYLDHLRMEEILQEPDPVKRFDLLLPFSLFTEFKQEGPTQWEAISKMARDCGQVGIARLVPIFKDPKYEAMQTAIMMCWVNANYHDAIPLLIDTLRADNRFWANQTPSERDLWINTSPTHVPTEAQQMSQLRTTNILWTLAHLPDSHSKPVLLETKRLWKGFYPSDKIDPMSGDCDFALTAIQNWEEGKSR